MAGVRICPAGRKGGGVNFSRVIDQVCGRLDAAGIRYALIGGFAMALRGVQRATMDLDWELLRDYLQLFGLEQRLGELRSIYGPVE